MIFWITPKILEIFDPLNWFEQDLNLLAINESIKKEQFSKFSSHRNSLAIATYASSRSKIVWDLLCGPTVRLGGERAPKIDLFAIFWIFRQFYTFSAIFYSIPCINKGATTKYILSFYNNYSRTFQHFCFFFLLQIPL